MELQEDIKLMLRVNITCAVLYILVLTPTYKYCLPVCIGACPEALVAAACCFVFLLLAAISSVFFLRSTYVPSSLATASDLDLQYAIRYTSQHVSMCVCVCVGRKGAVQCSSINCCRSKHTQITIKTQHIHVHRSMEGGTCANLSLLIPGPHHWLVIERKPLH